MTETPDNPTPQDGNEQPPTNGTASTSEPVATEPQEVVSGESIDDAPEMTEPHTTSEESTHEAEQDATTGSDESQPSEELPADEGELDTEVYVAQI